MRKLYASFVEHCMKCLPTLKGEELLQRIILESSQKFANCSFIRPICYFLQANYMLHCLLNYIDRICNEC